MHRFPFSRDTPVGRRRIRQVVLVAGAAGLGFGGLYLTGLLASGDDIPAGTQVNGVDIGGLNRSQAQQKLDTRIGDAWSSVKVRIGDRADTLDGRAAGLSLDSEETAARAARSGADPLTVIGGLFTNGDRDVEPVVRMDEAKARAALAARAKTPTRKPRDGAITFDDGKPTPQQPENGRTLDVDRALAALRSADPGEGNGPIQLPVRRTEARVDAAEVSRAMREFAKPAMSAPVTLTAGGRQIEISPAMFGEHLTMKPDKTDRLTPRLDGEELLNDPEMAR
ncbi:MAG: peptidoglycan binding domain-containing protein, partial [Stackebrandtia sp.]